MRQDMVMHYNHIIMLSMTLVSTEMYYQFVYWIEVTFIMIQ